MFKDFTEFSWFIVATLVSALIAGAAALIWKKRAKNIMLFWAGFETGIIAALLIYLNLNGVNALEAFEDIEIGGALYTVAVAVIVAAMLAVMYFTGRKEKWDARQIATAAMCVAMSFVLSCIKLYSMPQGGSLTPASLLPLIIYIVAFGPARGLVVGFAYGLLQLTQGAYVVHIAQLLLDYPLAFGALALGGFAGMLKLPEILKLPVGLALGFFGRYVMHVLSGAIYLSEFAGDQNAWVYSVVYNITYIGPDTLICVAVAFIPGFTRISKTLKTGVAS